MWTPLRKTFYRARGHVKTTLRDERFRTDPYHSSFWRKASAGQWEPETFALLDRHLDSGRDYLDIGAWIGPTVLYGARKARSVIALEPDPVAFRALSWNIELNGLDNVTALPLALADQVGLARMAGQHGEAGDSTTSLLTPDGAGGSTAVTLDFETFGDAIGLDDIALIKMDVEGAEFVLIPQMAPWLSEARPALLLSTHAPYLAADMRAELMSMIMDMLGDIYGQCRDAATGTPVTGKDIMVPDGLDRYRTLLFT